MKTFYRVDAEHWNPGSLAIESTPIVSETEHTITVAVERWGGKAKPEKRNKVTKYDRYFETYEEAYQFVYEKHQRNIAQLEFNLKSAKEAFAKLQSQKESA